ncbi:hypothetical protein J2TS6_31430 [Paenibacillus albilobatus]|uniref:Uncharacterized protein n=1 Tax=Paenibacillus albilobatus TaxID=2716884 RepID=A0A919XJQ9_9BACL|nr:hypothetical protein J2TS6_31430 [Paenibacillus albilobatus]
MQFTRESGLVKVWVSLVMTGTYRIDQVPELYNLKEVVSEVINGTPA